MSEIGKAIEEILEEDAREISREERLVFLKNRYAKEKSVGEPEDLIPFAWRYPPQSTGKKKKKSKQ